MCVSGRPIQKGHIGTMKKFGIKLDNPIPFESKRYHGTDGRIDRTLLDLILAKFRKF